VGTRHDQAIATVHFRRTVVPEVLITLFVNALSPNPDPSLLARWDPNRSLLSRRVPGMPTVLWRVPVSLAGMAGSEELLTRAQVNGHFVFRVPVQCRIAPPAPGHGDPAVEPDPGYRAHRPPRNLAQARLGRGASRGGLGRRSALAAPARRGGLNGTASSFVDHNTRTSPWAAS
jgi:hypothetical protein